MNIYSKFHKFMQEEHGLTLLDSEIQEIILEAKKVEEQNCVSDFKRKTVTIEIPIFKGTLEIIHDKDLKYVENAYNTKSLSGYGAVTLKDERQYRHYVIAFEYLDQGIIAHEVVHLVNYIFLDCGIELDRCNDETQAYLTGWLHDQIDKALKE